MPPINQKVPLGISLPIKNGGVGFFEQTYDTFTMTKTNIINLLRTRPGERRMQPTFGCRLYTAVFEQNTDILPEYITNLIKEDIGRWIPNVMVERVNVTFLKNEEYNNTDTYKIYITVKFTVNTINKSDSIDIVIDTNRI
jgi:phage baseplate assembly protein W